MAPKKKASAKKTTEPTQGEVTDPRFEGETAEESIGEQFPSVVGYPEVEIAERSADALDPTSSVREKDYVVLKSEYDIATTTDEGKKDFHQRNIDAERQALISQGLRPTGDGEFAGEEKHPDGLSVILHYTIPVKPAAVADSETEPEVAHAYVTEDDQHADRDPVTDNRTSGPVVDQPAT